MTVGLSKVEELIRLTWPKDRPSPFVRIGRSFIINQVYLSEISVLKQKLVLSDCMGHSFTLGISKVLLKAYKEKINEYYLKKNKI